MKLKMMYDSMSDVPTEYAALYTENADGRAMLTGVEGVKSQDDVTKLTKSLEAERAEHKATKKKLAAFDGLEPEEVRTSLAEIEELRIRAESNGTIKEAEIQKIVEARVAKEVGPVSRERDTLKTQLAEAKTSVEQLSGTLKKNTILQEVSKFAATAKVVPTALEDISLYAERVFDVDSEGRVVTRDGVGVVPGLTPDQWLTDMKEKRPHWWPASTGGGANGGNPGGSVGGGKNPWAADSWNLTEQGAYYRTHGVEKATKMAQAAGSFIGATAPTVKK